MQCWFSHTLCCCCVPGALADASAKLYRPHAYYAAKVAATTPFQIISALVFCFTVYGMAGLRPGAQFIWENGIISTLLSLIAVQVSGACVCLVLALLLHTAAAMLVFATLPSLALQPLGQHFGQHNAHARGSNIVAFVLGSHC